MNICFFIRALMRGGAERQLTNLACGLHKMGHDITVLTFYPNGDLEDELSAAGVTVLSLDKGGRWRIFGTLKRLIVEVRRIRPDVLHGYLPTANLLTLLAKPLIGHTKVIIGVRASDMDLSKYDVMAAWSYRIERVLSRFADGVIANSHAGAEIYKMQTTPEKVQVVPNGIDTEVFQPDSEASKFVQEELGVDASMPLIGMVARIDPMKDHETFLKSVAIVHNHLPSAQFVCIAANGESPAAMSVRKRANDLGIAGCVRWAGPFDDMSRVYGAFDLLVLSSVYGEGFPNVVAEAMACGVPAVVTDVGDAALVVGETGRVIPVHDADALAKAIIEMLSSIKSRRDEISSAARKHIMEEFSKDALVERTLQFITGVVTV